MKIISFFLIFTIFFSCSTNKVNHEKLKKELSEIYFSDQELRKLFTNNTSKESKDKILKRFNIPKTDFKNKGWEIVEEYDSLNLKRVEKIIKKYGYPGESLVGKDLSKVAFLVIQHSKLEKIQEYFPIIKKAYLEKELNPYYFAMLQDRKLMYKGKEQIYGTQVAGRYKYNKENNEYEWIYFIWPIQDKENVNEFRKKMNFRTSLEEYAKSMNINNPFLYTIEEANKMKKRVE